MMRSAVFGPRPFTLARAFTLPVAMIVRISAAEKADMIMRAVFAPIPLTVMSSRNSSRSPVVKKPNKSCVSSRMISVI